MNKNKKGDPRQFARIFGIIALVMFCMGVKAIWESNASKTWPVTQGKVLASYVRAPRAGAKQSLYTPVVQYEFAVAGTKFTSQRVSFGVYQSRRVSEAQAEAAHYPVGAEVKVYYKPNDPAFSVLEPGSKMSDYMMPLLALVFGSAGVWLWKTSQKKPGPPALGGEKP